VKNKMILLTGMLFNALAIASIDQYIHNFVEKIAPSHDKYFQPDFLKRLARKIQETEQIKQITQQKNRNTHDSVCKELCEKSFLQIMEEIHIAKSNENNKHVSAMNQDDLIKICGASCARYIIQKWREILGAFDTKIAELIVIYEFHTTLDELKNSGKVDWHPSNEEGLVKEHWYLFWLVDCFKIHLEK
jgi:hypothetical protein